LTTLSKPTKELVASAILEKNRRKALKPNAESCIYFIRSFCQTFDPRPDVIPHDIPFDLYEFQDEYVVELYDAILQGYDIFIEKSRDMGISWVTLAVIFHAWLTMPGFQALLGSRKEDYVDNGQIDSLFGKLDYLIDKIVDPSMLPKGFNNKRNRTYLKLENPVNGNLVKGESANKNFSRSGRYTLILYDEIGFWPDARNSWTAGGDATKCRIAITTPPNEPSFAKVLRFSNKIKIITYHWSRHPKKSTSWYEYETSRRTEEEVLHELDISWEYTQSGRPYPEADTLQVGQYAYDPSLPLYVSIDLGLDAVALGYYQPVRNSDWMTLIDAYENTDKVIDFFLPFFGKEMDSRFTYTDKDLKFIEAVKYWKPPICFGDPSGNQRHVESGKSPYKILQTHGINVQVNTEMNDWVSRRDETKRLLMHLRVNDTDGTTWWKECLKNSRYPKRDENSQSTTEVTKPVHDWTSHHRTQTEFMAVNYKKPLERNIIKRRYDPTTGGLIG
jgi:hypothetical protein